MIYYTNYTVLGEKSPVELEKKVKSYLEKGYVPNGGLTISTISYGNESPPVVSYLQAVSKPVKPFDGL